MTPGPSPALPPGTQKETERGSPQEGAPQALSSRPRSDPAPQHGSSLSLPPRGTLRAGWAVCDQAPGVQPEPTRVQPGCLQGLAPVRHLGPQAHRNGGLSGQDWQVGGRAGPPLGHGPGPLSRRLRPCQGFGLQPSCLQRSEEGTCGLVAFDLAWKEGQHGEQGPQRGRWADPREGQRPLLRTLTPCRGPHTAPPSQAPGEPASWPLSCLLAGELARVGCPPHSLLSPVASWSTCWASQSSAHQSPTPSRLANHLAPMAPQLLAGSLPI